MKYEEDEKENENENDENDDDDDEKMRRCERETWDDLGD